jgi:hypothetical protein
MKMHALLETLSGLQKDLLETFQEEYQMIALEKLGGLKTLQEKKWGLFQDYARFLQDLVQNPQPFETLEIQEKHAWAEASQLFADQAAFNQTTLGHFLTSKQTQFEAILKLMKDPPQERRYSPLEISNSSTPPSPLFGIQRSL